MGNSYLKLQVKSSGQYLSILGGGNANGTDAGQGNTPTTNIYLWEITDAPNNPGWSLIQVKSSGQYLNIAGASNANGAVACQGNTPTTDNFLWKITDAPNNPGWSLIQVKSSGQYLNILYGGNSIGQVACQGNTPTTANFFWQKVTAQSKPVNINLQINCPSVYPTPAGLVSDTIANNDLVFGDDNNGKKENGNESSFESFVNPGSRVTWSASTLSGNNSSYKVTIDQIVYDPGSGTGNVFNLGTEPGNSGKVVADVLWTAMEPASGDNEAYTVYFTITPQGGPNPLPPKQFWVDPKIRIKPQQ